MDSVNSIQQETPMNEVPARPTVETTDCTPNYQQTTHAAFNDFLLRLTALRAQHKEWDNPRNQRRPFKHGFVDFIHQLVLRLPVAPEITPLHDGTVRFRYRKMHAPKDKWQTMEIVIRPTRIFEMTVKSRLPDQAPFVRSNTARPDYLSDMVRSFYELDAVNTKDHPLRYRKANVIDYPYIAAMCQITFGPHAKYKPTNMSKLLQYCEVADDPMYGIVAVAALQESMEDNYDFEVSTMITIENYRGLSMASQCLRKAITNLLIDHPDARILAKSPMKDGDTRDVCHSALRRAGFRRIKIVRGEDRYRCFNCDRCNTSNGLCDFDNPDSVCSTVYYELTDRGGKMGYGGKKPAQ